VFCALVALGCARDPLDNACPPAQAGDLVVTEIRGPQAGADTWGQWIEIYNASGQDLALAGLAVEVLRIDGGDSWVILVRDHDLLAGAGEYVVLGRRPATNVPAHMTYGYLPDFDHDFPPGAVVTVSSCGTVIDEMVYRNLPEGGSWELSGAIDPPSAAANDDENSWCIDTTPNTSMTELGLPGSPRERNPSC